MKISFTRIVVGLVLISLGSFAQPVFANDDGDLLKQAEDLVHQAWNPGGDAPSNDQRTQLLTKAIELAQKEPDHHLHGTRVEAVRMMKAALEELKNGDPNNKATSDLQDADRALRTAIENAEGH